MKKNLLTAIVGLILLIGLYAGGWSYGHTVVKNSVANFIEDSAESGIVFDIKTLKVRGFPGPYRITYSGSVSLENNDNVLSIPNLVVRSFFSMGDDIEITADQGLAILNQNDQWLWSIDYLDTSLFLPQGLPSALTRNDLQNWYNRNGKLTLNDIILEKGNVSLNGDLVVQLDEALQPNINFSGQVYSAEEFVSELRSRDYIDVQQQLIATTIITPLMSTDEKTGTPYIDLNVKIMNQSVLIGPLQVGSVPLFRWP